jgi:hypothetical protein
LDVIAIPTLPALVPSLSSGDFSGQLRPLLMRLDALDSDPVWSRTRAAFHIQSAWLRPVPLSADAAPAGEPAVAATTGEGILQTVLSFAQEREAKRPARPPVVLARYAPAGTTPAQLQAALMSLVARHAALRTTFRHVSSAQAEGGRRKLVAYVKHAKQIDVAALLHVQQAGAGADERARVHELVAQQQALPFDLEEKDVDVPLLRVVLSLGAETARPVVVIAADRLIADAHSLHLIARELFHVRTRHTPYFLFSFGNCCVG